MKVVFVMFNQTWSPHFEIDLEILAQHIYHFKETDNLIFTNTEKLPSTISNPYGLYSIFLKEQVRLRKVKQKFDLSDKHFFSITNSKNCLKKHFNSFDALYHYSYCEIPFGKGVVSNIVSILGEYRFDLKKYQFLIGSILDTTYTVYSSFLKLIQTYDVHKVILFNGRFAEYIPVIALCKQLKISFFVHERGSSFLKYSYSKNCLPHDLAERKKKILIAWNDRNLVYEDKQKIAKEWFDKKVNGIDTSWFSHIKSQLNNEVPLISSAKRNIAIFNSSLNEYESRDDWKSELYKNETFFIRNIIAFFHGNNKYYFFFRVHPNLKRQSGINLQLKDINEIKRFDNVTVIPPESSVSSYKLMQDVDIVLVPSSTIGLEACFWGKPVILLGRSLYEDLDCAYRPKNFNEVINLLTCAELKPKPRKNALKYAYWAATHGKPFTYYKPKDFFRGTFMGENFNELNLSFKDKILMRLYLKLDQMKLKKLGI